MDSTPPPADSTPSKPKPSRGSIMLQLYLTPRQTQGRLLPPVSTPEHVGAHQNGLTCSWHSYSTSVCPSISCVPFPCRSGTWQCQRVTHKYCDLFYLVFASGFLPSPLWLLNVSVILHWQLFFPLTAQTASKNASCWQHAAINSTVVLCGWFSSNASLFIK